jgi:hypothetical protein
MKYTRLALAALALTASTTPALAKKAPEMSALALQQMQSREYDATKSISFPAVVTIFQDSGYRIQSADKDTGLITATASTKSKMTFVPFVGFGRSKKTPVVTAFIEDRGLGSRIRLNFVMAKIKSNGYGVGLSDEEPIVDPATYRDAFERIDKEVFTRLALAAPKPTATSAAAPALAVTAPAEVSVTPTTN